MTSTSTSSSIAPKDEQSLNLSIIGNCSLAALIDAKACVSWCCLPRFDADPVFCSLLRKSKDVGFFDVELQGFAKSSQKYIKSTPILSTTLEDATGSSVEIIDFAPRYNNFGRGYRPTMLIRIIKPKGRPSIRVRLRPTFGYGWGTPEKTRGSNHIRYLLPTGTLRLATNAPISYVLEEVRFELEEPIYLVIMPDESIQQGIDEFAISMYDATKNYWEEWTSNLAIPYEWQTEVIRAAITLKLCNFEETGAVTSAITTSIPFSPNGPRKDARYCSVQDMYFVVRTVTQLGQASTLNGHLRYISNLLSNLVIEGIEQTNLQPVYGIALETLLHGRDLHRLAGYRGQAPVVIGDENFKKQISGSYGALILALAPFFFDERVSFPGPLVLFYRMEGLGKRLLELYDKPGATSLIGFLENEGEIHILNALMCWGGCDRLAKISVKLGLADRAEFWTNSAAQIRTYIQSSFWNDSVKSFVTTPQTDKVDAYLLLLPEVGFVKYNDPLFVSTLAKIEVDLKRENSLNYSLEHKDSPTTFNAHLFWYINALHETGRKTEARQLFEKILSRCNCGALSVSAKHYN